MSDATAAEAERPNRFRKFLMPLAALLLAAGGFAVSYLGIWTPQLPTAEPASGVAVGDVVFVDIPQIVLSLPGARSRTLVMTVKIEASAAQAKNIVYMQPRIADAFNLFLAEIDPAAFERRGILEIIRNELVTRLSYILGPGSFSDLLVTEFRMQG